jgi:hypothetical protein
MGDYSYMKKANEMTREELEKAYNDLLTEKTMLLGEKIQLQKEYDNKKTYAVEYQDSLEKICNLRFASRVLCGLTAPSFILVYSTIRHSELPSGGLVDFLLSVVIWTVMGSFIYFFTRGLSEAEFTRALGVEIAKSKLVAPICLVLAAILFSLANF